MLLVLRANVFLYVTSLRGRSLNAYVTIREILLLLPSRRPSLLRCFLFPSFPFLSKTDTFSASPRSRILNWPFSRLILSFLQTLPIESYFNNSTPTTRYKSQIILTGENLKTSYLWQVMESKK